MKNFPLYFAASLMIGCASSTPSATNRPISTLPVSASPTAAALAFDPPLALNAATPDLSRDARGGAALVGFEEPSTSTYDVFTYNRQSSDLADYYDQEAVSERVGTTHR